ncbi:MAG: hypothetical protein LBK25_05815, partial [Treponema sp.]|nr:hypothetical protein [Treponema sp.]
MGKDRTETSLVSRSQTHIASLPLSTAVGVRRRLIRRWCQPPLRPPLVSAAARPPLVADAVLSAAGVRRRLVHRWCQTPPYPPLVSAAASSAAGVCRR